MGKHGFRVALVVVSVVIAVGAIAMFALREKVDGSQVVNANAIKKQGEPSTQAGSRTIDAKRKTTQPAFVTKGIFATTDLEKMLYPSKTTVTDMASFEEDSGDHNDRRWLVSLENARKFVKAACVGADGVAWIATESGGVQSFNPKDKEKPWKRYTKQEGLGDDSCYAIGCDWQGRIWVGHLNRGVSVFDGKKWNNYDVVGGLNAAESLSGPLGERVFDIAVSPRDGDVWIATNVGLSRYCIGAEVWKYYSTENGLPSNDTASIAFNDRGDIAVGLPNGRILTAVASEEFHVWRADLVPSTAFGGPSEDLAGATKINDLLYVRNELYVATNAGVLLKQEASKGWKLLPLRKGFIESVGVQAGSRTAGVGSSSFEKGWVTCLAYEANSRQLFIGYRANGVQVLQLDGGEVVGGESGGRSQDYVSAFVVGPGQPGMCAVVGKGLSSIPNYKVSGMPEAMTDSEGQQEKKMPLSAGQPTDSTLEALIGSLRDASIEQPSDNASVISLEDDWITQGQWTGRYGKGHAVLCAMLAPNDYVWGAGSDGFRYTLSIGSDFAGKDTHRYWIQELYTDDQRALEMPAIYLDSRIKRGLTSPALSRRKAEWDDHGEVYPLDMKGPDLRVTVKVPEDRSVLSFYEMNKEAQAHPDRFRDYTISFEKVQDSSRSDRGPATSSPNLVVCSKRVFEFGNGVYMRFLIPEAGTYIINIARDKSYNTCVSGLFVDPLEAIPYPYSIKNSGSGVGSSSGGGESVSERLAWQLDELKRSDVRVWARKSRAVQVQLARYLQVRERQGNLSVAQRRCLAAALYDIGSYVNFEATCRKLGIVPPRDIEMSLKWNGNTPNNIGRGREAVLEYISSKK